MKTIILVLALLTGCASGPPAPRTVFVTEVAENDGTIHVHRDTWYRIENGIWLMVYDSTYERIATYSIVNVKYVERKHE